MFGLSKLTLMIAGALTDPAVFTHSTYGLKIDNNKGLYLIVYDQIKGRHYHNCFRSAEQKSQNKISIEELSKEYIRVIFG